MAEDVKYSLQSGFFDAAEKDRTYGAHSMMQPHGSVISDGILKDPDEPRALQVLKNVRMFVYVWIGQAYLGGHWLVLPDPHPYIEGVSHAVVVTIAPADAQPRVDGIFLRVDTSLDERVGGVVYKKGTPAAVPTAPARSSDPHQHEVCLGTVYVAPGTTEITQEDITDLRGTDLCPYAKLPFQPQDTHYVAGDGIEITGKTVSVVPNLLTAGDGITITNGVISVSHTS